MKLIIAIISGLILCIVPVLGIEYNRHINGTGNEPMAVFATCFFAMVGLAIVTVYFAERHTKENQ